MSAETERKASGLSYMEVSENSPLVDLAKSRRLREILNRENAGRPKQPEAAPIAVEPDDPFDLPEDVAKDLLRARRIIDEEVDRIMRFFPESRKKSLFKLRFGALEEVRAMEVRAIFKRLKLDSRHANLNRLQKINYYGQKVS
ncbi:hypothetical protein [Candidatus Methylomicrobium oryzae]|jgi:hypothetical protein|uniref:hypothetical protein n=1 Tax=Candidatus Methylomicrobium oryzae TaxID=2802053 RepID=UPI0019236ABD|nr:hypothetical protein [Methylomicrobium sp. RS1]MBL1263770.1 hypothetical protein [Methylomicrobium sp. RS1]